MWDWDFVRTILPELLSGLLTTAKVTAIGSILGMAVGLMLAFIQIRKIPVASKLVQGYVYFVRGTPFLIQLYFLFFVLPDLGILLSPMQAGSIGLALSFSPYFSETFRAGIQSVPRSQWEAATALNLSTRQTWVRVVLPQAVRPITPALGNYVNAMFKVSALLFAISVQELFGSATAIGDSVFRYVEPMTIVGIFYLIVSVPVSLAVARVQSRQDISSR